MVSALLCHLGPRAARADSSIGYKYQDYREAGGRITIETQGAQIEYDFNPDTHLKIEGILDAIAGATPNGQPAPTGSDQVPLATLTDRRKAWSADLSRQIRRVNVGIGIANSRENDYISDGWSFNTLTDFNQKNTTLLAGVAGTNDDIKVFYQTSRAEKKTNDVIVGVTQLLSPRTSAKLNLTWGRQRGYLSDPYKLVQKSTQIFPGVFLPLTFAENRPGEREKFIVLAGINRAFPEAHGAIDATYRYYTDTNEIDSHTVDLAWFQRLGTRVILRPSLRLYEQTAADFYHYRLDGTPVIPVSGPPRPNGPFYSSDYRLSALRTTTLGLKLIWDITDALRFDAAFERYDMRGRDGVTPASAYCRADIVTIGLRFGW